MAMVVKVNDRYFIAQDLSNTQHARVREEQRGISKRQVLLAYQYGRIIHSRRAVYYVIGNKEIKKYAEIEPELKRMNGVQVVMTANGTVLTAFKNKDLRKVRPFKHCHKH